MGQQATRRRFTREFKLEAVRQIVREGRTQKQVAEELGLNANLLGRWLAVETRLRRLTNAR